MTSEEAWLIAIVGGAGAAVLAAGVLAIFSKGVRDKVWKPIGRGIRWLLSIRFTTSARQAAGERLAADLRERAESSARRFQEVCDLLDVTPVLSDSSLVPERIQQLQEAAAEAWAHSNAEVAAARAHAQEQIAATQALAQTQIGEELRINEGQIELARNTAYHEGHAAGRAEVTAEVEAQRAIPSLRPVWRIDEAGPAAMSLRNTQEGVEVSNVSVEAPTGDFKFAGSTQLRGRFDGPWVFAGERTRDGRVLGVNFTVKWQDANSDWWAQEVRVDREPRRITVL